MASYDYEPIPEDERKGKYCAAPRHGATRVQATFLEKYEAPELGVIATVSPSCDDCHDDMMRAFLDECLPEATEEELADADTSE